MSNHNAVAHAWANRTGRARAGFNMFHRDDTIFSYGSHFPIARLVEVEGRTVVLFTSRDYSVSTAKHKSIVRGACRQFEQVLVRDPSSRPDVSDFDDCVSRAIENVNKAKRARKYGDIHLAAAQANLDNANRLRELFALDRAAVTLESLDVAVADIAARIEAARLVEAERQRVAQAERFERETELRNAWKAGEAVRWHGYDIDGHSALMRVRGDLLETSLGASVPLAHAVRVFQFVKQCQETGRAWARNGSTIRVGHFQVDTIRPDGSFVAGCHSFRWEECERLARSIGVFDVAPSRDALEPSRA